MTVPPPQFCACLHRLVVAWKNLIDECIVGLKSADICIERRSLRSEAAARLTAERATHYRGAAFRSIDHLPKRCCGRLTAYQQQRGTRTSRSFPG